MLGDKFIPVNSNGRKVFAMKVVPPLYGSASIPVSFADNKIGLACVGRHVEENDPVFPVTTCDNKVFSVKNGCYNIKQILDGKIYENSGQIYDNIAGCYLAANSSAGNTVREGYFNLPTALRPQSTICLFFQLIYLSVYFLNGIPNDEFYIIKFYAFDTTLDFSFTWATRPTGDYVNLSSLVGSADNNSSTGVGFMVGPTIYPSGLLLKNELNYSIKALRVLVDFPGLSDGEVLYHKMYYLSV